MNKLELFGAAVLLLGCGVESQGTQTETDTSAETAEPTSWPMCEMQGPLSILGGIGGAANSGLSGCIAGAVSTSTDRPDTVTVGFRCDEEREAEMYLRPASEFEGRLAFLADMEDLDVAEEFWGDEWGAMQWVTVRQADGTLLVAVTGVRTFDEDLSEVLTSNQGLSYGPFTIRGVGDLCPVEGEPGYTRRRFALVIDAPDEQWTVWGGHTQTEMRTSAGTYELLAGTLTVPVCESDCDESLNMGNANFVIIRTSD